VAAPAPHPEALSAGSPPPAELWPSAALEPPVAEPVPPRPSEANGGGRRPRVGAVVEPKGKGQLVSDRVQNPYDPEATYAVKGQGQHKKEPVGYKVQVAETVCETVLAPGDPPAISLPAGDAASLRER